jgi:hypothetical protein
VALVVGWVFNVVVLVIRDAVGWLLNISMKKSLIMSNVSGAWIHVWQRTDYGPQLLFFFEFLCLKHRINGILLLLSSIVINGGISSNIRPF